jgi:hypothetical protein
LRLGFSLALCASSVLEGFNILLFPFEWIILLWGLAGCRFARQKGGIPDCRFSNDMWSLGWRSFFVWASIQLWVEHTGPAVRGLGQAKQPRCLNAGKLRGEAINVLAAWDEMTGIRNCEGHSETSLFIKEQTGKE